MSARVGRRRRIERPATSAQQAAERAQQDEWLRTHEARRHVVRTLPGGLDARPTGSRRPSHNPHRPPWNSADAPGHVRFARRVIEMAIEELQSPNPYLRASAWTFLAGSDSSVAFFCGICGMDQGGIRRRLLAVMPEPPELPDEASPRALERHS